MPYRVEFHEDADAEVANARNWYAARDTGAAVRFLRQLDAAVLEAPDRWPKQRYGTRRYRLDDFPYALVYRILGDVVRVIAVAHAKRRPGYWRSR